MNSRLKSMLAATVCGLLVVGAPLSAEPAPISQVDAPDWPPAQTIEEAFLRLQTNLSALNDLAASDRRISASAVTVIGAQINELQDIFTTSTGPAPDAEYVLNLDRAARALLSATEISDPDAANAVLGRIQRDFQIKLVSARATLGSQGGTPKVIPVEVTTTRGGAKVNGYFIKLAYAAPKEPPIFVFSNPSNPGTTRMMTPGVYYLYIYSAPATQPLGPPQEVDFSHSDSLVKLVAVVP